MVQIIIINGPNLNLLGVRQPEIYGTKSFDEYFTELEAAFPQFNLHYYQSNHEGDIIDKIQGVGYRYDGIILNAAGFTHTSIAISDALRAISTPVVEVHLTDIYNRESFRHVNYIKDSAIHSIVGHGLEGYREAIEFLRDHVIKNEVSVS
jgi:3-dehydroquinate dehydratase-2